MKKNIFLTLILGLFFSLSNAQTSVGTKTFQFANEGFSIEAPENLRIARTTSPDENGSRMYRADANGGYFFISTFANIDSSHFREILEYTGENKAVPSSVTINSLHARKFSFPDSDGFYQTILAVQGNKRFYIFQAVSETKDNPTAAIFFDSLRFEQSEPAESSSKSDPFSNIKINPDGQKEFSGTGQGTGGGSGSGIGSGNPENDQNRDLKLISKPSAKYTNLARFYQIQGTISLRVTFLADGTIGGVETTSKLPFGLTNSAIKAAKAMRFLPALRNGQPYNITKNVRYDFTIF